MKKQVLLFCNYTSHETRAHLDLSSLKWDNILRTILHNPVLKYIDAAPWIRSFIDFFKDNEEYELHIAAIQQGLIPNFSCYEDGGVYFHYIKSGLGFWGKLCDKLFNRQYKNDFPLYQNRFKQALNNVHPELVMICGAENPDYATSFLSFNCQNKIAILQTLMNDPKRIEMGVSTPDRMKVENRVLRACNHILVPDVAWVPYINRINSAAFCHIFVFPTVRPTIVPNSHKEFDFVFFAAALGKNKGTDDLIEAMSAVAQKYPQCSLNIIGGGLNEYMQNLRKKIISLKLENNISLTPPFPRRDQVFERVACAKFVVLPSITATLNSTVREVMLIGLPVIVYESSATKIINKDTQCLLCAKMEDISDLAFQMIFAIEHEKEMRNIGMNGLAYAEKHFTQESFNNSFRTILNTTSK